MKALVKSKAERGLWLADVPEPKCGDNDVLIKVKKTAICGTDLHIYQWDDWAQKTIPVPLVTGHEFSGEIVELGKNVTRYSVGQRVSGEGHIVCGACRNCRAGTRHLCKFTEVIGVNIPGSFAEYITLPASNVFVLPEEITDEVGAILDPFGNAVHTALSFDLIGEDVLITGAGSIGIMAAKVCQHVGARNVVLTDINPDRLELASKMGVKTVVNSLKKDMATVMKEVNMVEGFDVGLEMSGAPAALSDQFNFCKTGAKIALLGILPNETNLELNQVIFKGLQIKGVFGREMFETWYKMKALIQSGLELSPIITHRAFYTEFDNMFKLMESGKTGKIVLDW